MRRLWGLVRRADDVAEVLIFDVALGSRRRRRVAAGLAACAGLALYAASGVLFVPIESFTSDRFDSAPLVDDATSHAASPALNEAADKLEIRPERRVEIEAELARAEPEMERARMLLHQGGWKFAGVARFDRMRGLAKLFIVRGLARAARDPGDEMAMVDWATAGRVGLAMATRRAHLPTMLEGRVSTRIQLRAFEAIKKHVDAGRMGHRQEVVLHQWLSFRRSQHVGMPIFVAGERDFRARLLRQSIERGILLDRWSPLDLQLLQPVTREGRREFAGRLRAAMEARGWATGVARPSRLDLVCALFSRDRAVDYMARTIAHHVMTEKNITSILDEELERTVRHVAARCNPLDLDGI